MVYDTKPFPDLEAGLVEWLSTQPELLTDDALMGYKHVGDELPSKYASRLPFVVLEVGEGFIQEASLTVDVSLDVYGEERSVVRDLAAVLFARLEVYPRVFGGVSVDAVKVTAFPSRSKTSEPDSDTYCFSGTASMTFRR